MNAAKSKRDESRGIWPPEIRIALLGFLTAFLWELWQMPFYEMEGLSVMAAVRGCSMGAFGDAGIMVAAYSAAGRLSRDRWWFLQPSRQPLLIYLGIGLVVTIAIEQLALRSRLGWNYSDRMPIDPLLGTGLIPIAMWIVLPLVVLMLVRGLSMARSPE